MSAQSAMQNATKSVSRKSRPAASRQQHAKNAAVNAMSVVQNAAAREEPDYELPPVESATTSLASLLGKFVASDDNE